MMGSFSPSEIATWCAGRWDPDVPHSNITGFSKDTRSISESECYVALVGEKYDGHDFVRAAGERGASCAVVSHDVGPQKIPLLRTGNTCAALQDIALGYRKKVDPFVIGVTGSSGKTTVKEMIASCLQEDFRVSATEGNLNNHIGVPLSLLSMSEDTECAVLEAGMNHPGELRPLCEVMLPDWGVVTNVGPVHLEHFDSIDAIAREKAVLLESSREHAFIDADSAYFNVLSSSCSCPYTTVSREEGDYIYGLDGALQVLEKASGESIEIALPVPGLHIAYDAAMACAVARKRGVAWEVIRQGLAGYKPLPMRWEVREVGGVMLVNDAYNANPMSMRASIRAFLNEASSGRRHLVLGDMLELGEVSLEEHRALGCWLEGRGVHALITVGEQAREIAKAASSFCEAEALNRAEEVCDLLKAGVKDGDSVLFKGSRGVHLEVAVSGLIELLK